MYEFSPAEKKAREYSTLDLCCQDSFTLIVNSSPAQAEKVSKLFKLLRKTKQGQTAVPLRVVTLGKDFDVVFKDQAIEFIEAFRLGEGQCGGVLIRPDQHIAGVLEETTSAQQLANDIYKAAGL